VEGAAPDTASLIAPNHVGYLDIIAVGAACPVVFVSKADVRSWPIVGHLFSFSEHIGVARADRRSLAAVNASIAERLSAGMSVCVFLEGTSSCGTGLLPFHASLAQPAVDSGAPVVPVALRWESDSDRVNIVEDVAYWRPEHAFAPHAWRALGLRGLRVTVRFGQPIPATARDRKELAASAREQVLRLLGGAGAQA
jgi:1-acyl-sn-glycerol-3-phosphate acyltransferase